MSRQPDNMNIYELFQLATPISMRESHKEEKEHSRINGAKNYSKLQQELEHLRNIKKEQGMNDFDRFAMK